MNKKIAVLVDGDNVPFDVLQEILQKISKLDYQLTIRRIYANWSNKHIELKKTLIQYGFKPVQSLFGKGKNMADMSLIIDAMDIMYTKEIDGFAIISSDQDFIPLVSRLKEQNLILIGAGEKEKLSKILPNFYDIFIEISKDKENQSEGYDYTKELIHCVENIGKDLNIGEKISTSVIGSQLRKNDTLEKYKRYKKIGKSVQLWKILKVLDFLTLELSENKRFLIKKTQITSKFSEQLQERNYDEELVKLLEKLYINLESGEKISIGSIGNELKQNDIFKKYRKYHNLGKGRKLSEILKTLKFQTLEFSDDNNFLIKKSSKLKDIREVLKERNYDKELVDFIEGICANLKIGEKISTIGIGGKLRKNGMIQAYKNHKNLGKSKKLWEILKLLELSTLKLSDDNRFLVKILSTKI